jgi:cation:H+ antiporter
MAPAILQFVLAAAVVVLAGTFLTRSADTIAERTGWGRLWVGGLFLAGATSLPELTVGISAIRQSMPNLAVGDLIGSSLFNLLILAVLDFSHHSKRRMFSHAAANHAISATMSSTLYLLAAMDILFGARFGSVTFGGLGVGSAGILVAYLLGIRLIFHDQRAAVAATGSRRERPRERKGLSRALVVYCISATALMVAAPFLSAGAGEIARISGLGETFLGTTAVALCTSLPEMVTSYAALRIGAFDLALGNIFGSNAFNMLLLVPLDLAQPGSLLSLVSTAHAFTCLATVLITAIVVMGQLYQAERRIFFVEPDAMLVILLVLASLTVIFWLR